MIVKWFLQVLFAVLGWLLSLFPTVAVPSWVTDESSNFATWLGYAQGMGAWLPLGLAFTVIGVVFICVAAGFTIRVVRIVASFLTLGGGAAG